MISGVQQNIGGFSSAAHFTRTTKLHVQFCSNKNGKCLEIRVGPSNVHLKYGCGFVRIPQSMFPTLKVDKLAFLVLAQIPARCLLLRGILLFHHFLNSKIGNAPHLSNRPLIRTEPPRVYLGRSFTKKPLFHFEFGTR